MPTRRENWGIFDPRGEHIVRKLKRGESSERRELDPKYGAFAFSWHAEVAVLLCHNWLRDPNTGLRGRDLPDLRLVHMYDKDVDGGEYQQAFRVIMWSLRAVDPGVDTPKLAWAKHELWRASRLGFERAEQQDKLAWLYEKARQFEEEGAFLRPRLFAIGTPIASEKYGKGALLERLERTVTLGKGGVHETRIGIGDVNPEKQ